MIISNLKIRNFRNYGLCEVSFIEKINIFLGDNAQGKTNILESLYFLSSTKSFRDAFDKEMIKEGEKFSNVEINVLEENRKKTISSVLHTQGKTFLLNKQPIVKMSEFIGELNTVLFSPQDLDFFHTSPKTRRKFIDIELGKISKKYLYALKSYNQFLKERNSSLKQKTLDESYVDIVTEQLIESQVKLLEERKELIEILNKKINKFYFVLSETKQVILIKYLASIEEASRENYIKKYRNNLEKDIFLGQTTLGVHRDDIEFYMDNRKATQFASQGQKRMIILALKLALCEYIFEKTKRNPVLLLDDVLSELDNIRRKNLFKVIPDEIQTFITTTDLDELDFLDDKETKTFIVKEGTIKLYKEDHNAR